MRISKTKRDIGYSIIYKTVSLVVPLITSPYLSRTLGPEKLGEYNYVISIAFYFFYFAMLGVNDYGNREIARARSTKEKLSDTFWQIYYMQLFLTIISLIIYFLIIQLILREYIIIGTITGLYVLSAAIDINWFLYGCEKFKYCSFVFSFQKLFVLICIIFFVKCENDLWKYVLIVNGNLIVFTLLFWPIAIKETDFKRPDLHKIISGFKPNLLLFLPIIASSIYSQMDKIMMGCFRSNAEIAYYSLAENIINIFSSIAIAINAVMLPKSSMLMEQGNEKDSLKLLYKTSYFLNAINIGLVFVTLCISYYLIPWYLGEKYIFSAYILNLLVPIVLLIGLTNSIRSQYLIPNRNDKVYISSIIVGAIVNFLLNMVVIPEYGAPGASITTIIAYVVVLLIQCIYTRNQIDYFKIVKGAFPYLIIGLVMMFIIEHLPTYGIVILTIIVKGGLGTLIYILLSAIWYKKCTKLVSA